MFGIEFSRKADKYYRSANGKTVRIPNRCFEIIPKEPFYHTNIPTVVVLVSGRPMILEPILGVADAIVAAWLPGSEGDGVADVLFGTYKPTGKLSHTWPKSMAQIPIHVGPKGDKPKETPLFEYGFGLSYERR